MAQSEEQGEHGLGVSELDEHESGELDVTAIAALISFFKLLDKWERENAKVV
jgi:hypothetical protein